MKKKVLKISIIGKTNAGKSTLINSLVGETISIINKKINTTEELIIGILNIKHHQLIFYDTPGLHFGKNYNNRKLKKNLWDGLNNSDFIFKMKKESPKGIKSRYEWNNIVKNYEDLFYKIIT